MEAVQIRFAQPSDLDGMTAIAHAAKRHWGYSEELITLWSRDLTVRPEHLTEGLALCALIGERLVGCCVVSPTDTAYELDHMWIHPELIGTGVGTALFRRATEELRSRGGGTMRIASDPHAEGFYRRMGARRIGETPSSPAGRFLPLLEFAP